VIHPCLAAGQIEGGVAQGSAMQYSKRRLEKWAHGECPDDELHYATSVCAADTVYFEEMPYEYGPLEQKVSASYRLMAPRRRS